MNKLKVVVSDYAHFQLPAPRVEETNLQNSFIVCDLWGAALSQAKKYSEAISIIASFLIDSSILVNIISS